MSAADTDLAFAGVAGQAAALAEGRVTAPELVDLCLERIDRIDPQLRAFRVVLAEQARDEAAAAQYARENGDQRPLLGVPIAVKDTEAVAGLSTQLGTGSREPIADTDADVVRRLRNAGMVVVGKTNLPELALWGFTESATHGVTRNPWDPQRTPGGSSGGSAAAVAAGLVPAAHASDGLGSIRIPAAFTGLVGLKPTAGRLPPTDPTHWSGMSTNGFLTRTVADTVTLLDSVLPDGLALPEPRPLRVGWTARPPLPGRVAGDVTAALMDAVDELRDLGHGVEQVRVRYGDLLHVIAPRWSRGAHDDLSSLVEPDKAERRTRQWAAIGARVPDSALRRAAASAARVSDRVDAALDGLDVLAMPTTATPAFATGLGRAGLPRTLLALSQACPFAAAFNISGHPALSVPVGRSGTGLPIGVQLVARHGDDALLLAVAAQLEKRLRWAERRPPVG